MAFILKAFEVTVDGYGSARYEAINAAKARAKAYRDFCDVLYRISFHDFLTRSTVRRVDAPHFGEPVVVGGKPAYRCLGLHGQYVRFARDDCETVFLSHPADVLASAEAQP